mgnify:CR=1 FL=1
MVSAQLEIPMIELLKCISTLLLLVYLHQILYIVDQVKQLLIILIVVVRNDRNTVLQLIKIGVSCVIDEQHILQSPVLQYSQILYVNTLLSLPTVRTEQSVTHKFSLWIKVVQNHISVALMTSCEYYNLAHLRKFLKQLFCIRSYVDPSINFLTSWKFNPKCHIMG